MDMWCAARAWRASGRDDAWQEGTETREGGKDKEWAHDGPQSPTETDPRAPEVTRAHNSAKPENGIFGISALRGFSHHLPFDIGGGGGDAF